ncbi:hypothetical protein Pelo_15467 [Pelomyxa schiedti]|nr:hypothetical protein Pelo_15467 [Pelomyxa schiedti]
MYNCGPIPLQLQPQQSQFTNSTNTPVSSSPSTFQQQPVVSTSNTCTATPGSRRGGTFVGMSFVGWGSAALGNCNANAINHYTNTINSVNTNNFGQNTNVSQQPFSLLGNSTTNNTGNPIINGYSHVSQQQQQPWMESKFGGDGDPAADMSEYVASANVGGMASRPIPASLPSSFTTPASIYTPSSSYSSSPTLYAPTPAPAPAQNQSVLFESSETNNNYDNVSRNHGVVISPGVYVPQFGNSYYGGSRTESSWSGNEYTSDGNESGTDMNFGNKAPSYGSNTARGNSSTSTASSSSGTSGNSGKVPLFVRKLWDAVNSPSNKEVISWSRTHNNTAFVVRNIIEFTSRELPAILKHTNYAGFVKQLYNYGFSKIEEQEVYAHPQFLLNAPHLLKNVVRTKRQKPEPPPPVTHFRQPPLPASSTAPGTSPTQMPKLQDLAMQLAFLRIQAEENKSLLEEFIVEVGKSQNKEMQLVQMAHDLATNAYHLNTDQQTFPASSAPSSSIPFNANYQQDQEMLQQQYAFQQMLVKHEQEISESKPQIQQLLSHIIPQAPDQSMESAPQPTTSSSSITTTTTTTTAASPPPIPPPMHIHYRHHSAQPTALTTPQIPSPSSTDAQLDLIHSMIMSQELIPDGLDDSSYW